MIQLNKQDLFNYHLESMREQIELKNQYDKWREENETKALVLNGENEIIIEFLEGMEFQCDCGSTTYIELQKYTE